jgi:hypothetical protein
MTWLFPGGQYQSKAWQIASGSREAGRSKTERVKFITAAALHRRVLGHPTRDAHVEPRYSTVRQFAVAPDGSLGERL